MLVIYHRLEFQNIYIVGYGSFVGGKWWLINGWCLIDGSMVVDKLGNGVGSDPLQKYDTSFLETVFHTFVLRKLT